MEVSEEIDFITMLLPLAGITLIITIGVVLMYQQFQKSMIKQRLAKEALKGEHQKELLRRVVQTQEEERTRIAQDLHDELGAILSIGRMQLVQLEGQDKVAPHELVQVRELMETTLASTRRISHQLMPLQLSQLGLEKALLSFLSVATKTAGIEVKLAIEFKREKLFWLLELGLYRIYMELINNTLKHANTSFIGINIYEEDGKLFCDYQDNGKGLPQEMLIQGAGLQSLQNRIKVLEGEIDFGNSKKGGFFCRFNVPLDVYKMKTN